MFHTKANILFDLSYVLNFSLELYGHAKVYFADKSVRSFFPVNGVSEGKGIFDVS